jgi:hypothetical protein
MNEIRKMKASSVKKSRLKANALKGKRLLCQNRKDCHRLGCDLDLAD